MRGFVHATGAFLALCYGLATLGLAGFAVLAALGFAVPLFDLFNHLQPVLFFGCLAALLAAPLFLRSFRAMATALALSATGLVASGFVYLPEAIGGFTLEHSPAKEGTETIRLMTFNVFGRNETPMAIVDTVLAVEPDIVALQEYSFEVRNRIHQALLAHYPHFQYCQGGERAFVGLYSKIAFTPLERGTCPASIMSQDRTARIIAQFLPQDGAPFVIATTHNDWPAPISRQQEQLGALVDALSGVEGPLMLVGDFNSTPWSYALRTFQSRAGLTRHTRNLPTFPTLWYYLGDWRATPAILPIDHVMTRGGINVHSLETGPASGSDHLPVVVEFSVAEERG